MSSPLVVNYQRDKRLYSGKVRNVTQTGSINKRETETQFDRRTKRTQQIRDAADECLRQWREQKQLKAKFNIK